MDEFFKENHNVFYSTGILLTFIVGITNLWLTLKNSKKAAFVTAITSSRIKYIQELRDCISDFCGLVYSYNLTPPKMGSEGLFEFHRQADKIKYLIRLYLNPEDRYWDEKIINLLSDILQLTDKNPNDKIEELIVLTQYLLKLEWEGAKLESEKGILSVEEKQSLYKKYEILHAEHVQKKH